MMRLRKTNDGMYGVEYKGKTLWYTTLVQATAAAWKCFPNKEPDEFVAFLSEINYAVETMTKCNHNVAEFGVMGGFIFSKAEDLAIEGEW